VTTIIKDRLKEFTTESDWKSRVSAQKSKEIWSIGGGKGGVGKSLTTANLSICLALMGYKVVSIDLDLGGANLHTCLGANIPALTLSDFLTKKVSNFDDLITPTPIDNLSIISGAHDDFGMANLKQVHKAKILHQLYEMDADFVLLDLGAGTTYNTLDFFLAADKGIMTTLPEPTSIENTYRFIKSVFHRKLSLCDQLLDVNHLIDQAMNSKITGESNPSKMINEISNKYPELGEIIKAEISDFIPNLIINQTRTQADIDIGFSMKFICQKYFGFSLDYTGYLEHDPSVWQSVKKRKPLLTEFPNSPLIHNFESIVHKLIPNQIEKNQEKVG
tara:strand:- start:8394 stop:9389 length:996 start_codon:yes stop_codon:yes gene_type:complete